MKGEVIPTFLQVPSWLGGSLNHSLLANHSPFLSFALGRGGSPEPRHVLWLLSFPRDLLEPVQMTLVIKNLPANAGDMRDVGLIPGLGRFPWRREWQPTPIFLPGKSQGQRSLAGYSP